MNKIIPIIVQCGKGQRKEGVGMGGVMLYNYLKNAIAFDRPIIINEAEFDNFNYGQKILKNYTNYIIKSNKFPLILGGDHSISYGSISGLLEYYRENIHILWIDSHTDINTEVSSVTKNKHGMVVSSLMGMNNWGENTYDLQSSQITYIGPCSLDSFEREFIKRNNITLIPKDKIYNIDLLNKIPKDKPIHISFDVDVIDKHLIPCTGTPVNTGLLPLHIQNIIDMHKKQIVSMDIVEFNPYLCNDLQNDLSMKFIYNSINNLFN